jgi:hypothetical protein
MLFLAVFQQDIHCLSRLLFIVAVLMSPLPAYSDDSEAFSQQWQIDKKWTGDFDGMVERRKIRVLVTDNQLLFFFDKASSSCASCVTVISVTLPSTR